MQANVKPGTRCALERDPKAERNIPVGGGLWISALALGAIRESSDEERPLESARCWCCDNINTHGKGSHSPEERKAAMRDVIEQCKRVAQVHQELLRGDPRTETKAMMVRRLIRTLVAEWV